MKGWKSEETLVRDGGGNGKQLFSSQVKEEAETRANCQNKGRFAANLGLLTRKKKRAQ